jgi:hypothetical protein
MTQLIVNGEVKHTDKVSLDYYDIVDLAFGKPMKALQTITYYSKGTGDTLQQGMVWPHGPAVKICEDMRINCTYTGNA